MTRRKSTSTSNIDRLAADQAALLAEVQTLADEWNAAENAATKAREALTALLTRSRDEQLVPMALLESTVRSTRDISRATFFRMLPPGPRAQAKTASPPPPPPPPPPSSAP